ncbi:MAG: cytochrome ubiquinol oxidase subunit I [Bryobacterales bacterium]
MELDPLILSRLQFTLTIMFHYLFPPLTIGMGVVLVYLEGMFLKTREPIYETAARFWTSLYAVTFAVGDATGIVMEFQFGTNWAAYSRFVGDVFGSALAAEGIFAFFLESGFLAILVFGWDKVGPKVHFFATTMVAMGSMFSAIWIVVANSWQQTPAGHHIVQMTRDGKPWFVDGQPVMRAEITDFWAMVLNPSTLDRITHVWIGCFIVGAFFIMSISAWYLLHDKHQDFARRSFTGGLIFATIFSLAALVSGDSNAKMVAKNQPAKLAAFEGHFETGPAGFSVFGMPNEETKTLDSALVIPGSLSYALTGSTTGTVIGLDVVPDEYEPPLKLSYWSFHIMVGLGMAFIALTLYASWLRMRGKLFEKRWLLWVFVVAVIGPFVANEIGWVAAEVGRQPWIVHPTVVRDAAGAPALDANGMLQYHLEEGLMTRNALSENVSGAEVLTSIILFGVIYGLLFWVWLFVLHQKISAGPQPVHPPDKTTAKGLKPPRRRSLRGATGQEG